VSYITKGDFATLSNFLSESGIEKKDIDELKTVIDIDNPKAEKREFGNKVKLWVTKMIGKAMDNSWKIGLGAAGKLLADAIEIYYGWK
jgi:hypothetical protein